MSVYAVLPGLGDASLTSAVALQRAAAGLARERHCHAGEVAPLAGLGGVGAGAGVAPRRSRSLTDGLARAWLHAAEMGTTSPHATLTQWGGTASIKIDSTLPSPTRIGSGTPWRAQSADSRRRAWQTTSQAPRCTHASPAFKSPKKAASLGGLRGATRGPLEQEQARQMMRMVELRARSLPES